MSTRRTKYNPLLKSYPDSERINSVSEGAEVLYCRLIAQTDDGGCYYADPLMVLAKLFSHRMLAGLTAEEVAKRIAELESVGLISIYEAGGKKYLQLVNVYKALRRDVSPQVFFPQPVPESVTETGRSRAGCVADSVRQPETGNPTQPETQPNHTQKPAVKDSAFAGLTKDDLSDPSFPDRWCFAQQAKARPVVDASEATRMNVRAAAAKAVSDKSIKRPVAVFAWIVSGKRWEYLRASHDDIAREMRKQGAAKNRAPPAVHLVLKEPPRDEAPRTPEQVRNQIHQACKPPP